jgi:uncharacterized protein YkwD
VDTICSKNVPIRPLCGYKAAIEATCKAITITGRLKQMSCYRVYWFFYFMLCWVVLGFSSAGAAARETYLDFSARIVVQAQKEGDIRPDLENQIFSLVNRFRKSNGLPTLALDLAAQRAARAHAMDMLLNNFMGHVSSTGHDFDSRMRALNGGALILPSMAENAARLTHAGKVDSAVATKLFEQWVKSPAHRKTLLSLDYLSVATGAVSKEGQVYADQIFTGPKSKSNMSRSDINNDQGLY